jgi:hypothetical protein
MRILMMALASVASIAAAQPQCETIRTPFALPPDAATADWGDADWSEWLDNRAAIYCARHDGSAWCACYASGAYDL